MKKVNSSNYKFKVTNNGILNTTKWLKKNSVVTNVAINTNDIISITETSDSTISAGDWYIPTMEYYEYFPATTTGTSVSTGFQPLQNDFFNIKIKQPLPIEVSSLIERIRQLDKSKLAECSKGFKKTKKRYEAFGKAMTLIESDSNLSEIMSDIREIVNFEFQIFNFNDKARWIVMDALVASLVKNSLSKRMFEVLYLPISTIFLSE